MAMVAAITRSKIALATRERSSLFFPLSRRIALSSGFRDDAKHFRVLTSMPVHRVSLMSKTMIRNWIGYTPARCGRLRRRRIDSAAMGFNTRADNAEKMRHVSATKLLYPFSIRDISSTRVYWCIAHLIFIWDFRASRSSRTNSQAVNDWSASTYRTFTLCQKIKSRKYRAKINYSITYKWASKNSEFAFQSLIFSCEDNFLSRKSADREWSADWQTRTFCNVRSTRYEMRKKNIRYTCECNFAREREREK